MKLRHLYIILPLLFGSTAAVHAAVSVSIGINMPTYPRLVPVPGYPVYYDPYANSNYFFYDGMYWVYQNDNWYASDWYNGPWQAVNPYDVPLFVLRVPVRYYRHPPTYFRGWRSDAPPRWNEHWGHDWAQQRGGWDRWDRRNAPRAAPLPDYQRQYSKGQYPHAIEQQHAIRSENYRYQPHEAVTRQHFQQQDHRDDAQVNPRQQVPSREAPRVEQRPQQMQAPQEQRDLGRRDGNRPDRQPEPAKTQPRIEQRPQQMQTPQERREPGRRDGDRPDRQTEPAKVQAPTEQRPQQTQQPQEQRQRGRNEQRDRGDEDRREERGSDRR